MTNRKYRSKPRKQVPCKALSTVRNSRPYVCSSFMANPTSVTYLCIDLINLQQGSTVQYTQREGHLTEVWFLHPLSVPTKAGDRETACSEGLAAPHTVARSKIQFPLRR